MKISVEIVNAFIDGDVGGNLAGVVFDADNLSSEQKLQVAKLVGLSETAFISQSSIATVKLEFFTPERQIPHCGHATIAVFSRLSELGKISNGRMSKETIDGIREIIVNGDMAYMEQLAPKYSVIKDFEAIRLSLNLLDDFDLKSARIVDTGNAFLLIPFQNSTAVAAVQPEYSAIQKISKQYNLIGYYIFSMETAFQHRDAGTRMFAPRYGILEESATGMAAGPLACLLRDHFKVDKDHFEIEQGRLMHPPSPSLIKVDLNLIEGNITSLMVGGKGKLTNILEVDI
ncbi:PhzF family phenazine biosynthesis protein [Acinetobacter dispersus]|uniref:PhzF family phenazine biosynthesis protein n=1 Tax=Acinetobacter dispersus TaxID=70348 RepID=UPI0030092A12